MKKHNFLNLQNRYQAITTTYKKALFSKLYVIFRAGLLISLGYILIYPLIYMVVMSIRDIQDLYDTSVKWIPKHYTLENIITVWKAMDYPVSLMNTLFLSVSCSVLSVITCSMAGYGLARFKFKFQGLLMGLVFIIIIVPQQVYALPSYLNFKYTDFLYIFNTINAIFGTKIFMPPLIGSYSTFLIPALLGNGLRAGLYIYIFRQFFKGIPKELEEAAYIDGCGYFKTFVKIMLPSSIPAIVTCFLFSFVWNWNEYQLTSLFLEGKNTLSSSLIILRDIIYKSQSATGGNDYFDTNHIILDMQAGALLVVMPVLIVYIAFQRFFVESIQRTGLVE